MPSSMLSPVTRLVRPAATSALASRIFARYSSLQKPRLVLVKPSAPLQIAEEVQNLLDLLVR